MRSKIPDETANSVDPDRLLLKKQSDLGLHCLLESCTLLPFAFLLAFESWAFTAELEKINAGLQDETLLKVPNIFVQGPYKQ